MNRGTTIVADLQDDLLFYFTRRVREKVRIFCDSTVEARIHSCRKNDTALKVTLAVSLQAVQSVCLVRVKHAIVNAVDGTIHLGHYVDVDAPGLHEATQLILATCFLIQVGFSHHRIVLSLELSLRQKSEVASDILFRLEWLMPNNLKLVVYELIQLIEIGGDPSGAMVSTASCDFLVLKSILPAVMLTNAFNHFIITQAQDAVDTETRDFQACIDRETSSHHRNVKAMRVCINNG